MSTLEVNAFCVNAADRTVVNGANILVRGGNIHILMGPNGSGKSSLLNALLGHPRYRIVGGTILFDGRDITNLPTEEKARLGIFLSLQHLPEIPGVTLTNFLYKAVRAQCGDNSTPLEFYKKMEVKAQEFGIDPGLLKKQIHSGLSGGEKKLSEVLQLVALEPACALLDEIDSGVDVDALQKVFNAIGQLKQKGAGFLIVSHHPRLLEHIVPDAVSVMKDGKIVASGGKELAERIVAGGFRDI